MSTLLNEIMQTLEAAGTAQNRKIYARHGVSGEQFGVSFANIRKLQKKHYPNTALAKELWKTGNADAMTLGALIADPAEFTEKDADVWLKDISYYGHSNMLGGLVGKTAFADKKMKEWMKSKAEITKHCGYDVLATRLRIDPNSVSDADCKKILKTIEKEIHTSPNRARNGMNMALIAIGGWKPALTDMAIEAAKRIGKVDVDHGETGCKTADAVPYIKKMVARRKK